MKIDEAVENLEQCLSRPSGTGSIIVPEDALRSMLAEVDAALALLADWHCVDTYEQTLHDAVVTALKGEA